MPASSAQGAESFQQNDPHVDAFHGAAGLAGPDSRNARARLSRRRLSAARACRSRTRRRPLRPGPSPAAPSAPPAPGAPSRDDSRGDPWSGRAVAGSRLAGASFRAGAPIAAGKVAGVPARLRAARAGVGRGLRPVRRDAVACSPTAARPRLARERACGRGASSRSSATPAGLATGYFEPLVDAARPSRAGFRVALHGPPGDLASRKPYWTRLQLDALPARRGSFAGTRSPGCAIRSTPCCCRCRARATQLRRRG